MYRRTVRRSKRWSFYRKLRYITIKAEIKFSAGGYYFCERWQYFLYPSPHQVIYLVNISPLFIKLCSHGSRSKTVVPSSLDGPNLSHSTCQRSSSSNNSSTPQHSQPRTSNGHRPSTPPFTSINEVMFARGRMDGFLFGSRIRLHVGKRSL